MVPTATLACIAGDASTGDASQQDTLPVAALTKVLSIVTGDEPCKLAHIIAHARSSSTEPPQEQISETGIAYSNFHQLQSSHLQTLNLLHSKLVFSDSGWHALKGVIERIGGKRSGKPVNHLH